MEPKLTICERLLVRLGIEGETTTKVLEHARIERCQGRAVVSVEFPIDYYRTNREACKTAIETLRGAARAKNLKAAYNTKGTRFYIGK